MQSFINFMLFLIFVPVVGSILLLVKRLREMPDGNRAREELLNELMALQNKNKKTADDTADIPGQSINFIPENAEDVCAERSAEVSLSEEDLAVMRAKENAAALREQVKQSEPASDPEKQKKDEAAQKVVQMMTQGKKSGFSKTDLDSMIAEFSNNKK